MHAGNYKTPWKEIEKGLTEWTDIQGSQIGRLRAVAVLQLPRFTHGLHAIIVRTPAGFSRAHPRVHRGPPGPQRGPNNLKEVQSCWTCAKLWSLGQRGARREARPRIPGAHSRAQQHSPLSWSVGFSRGPETNQQERKNSPFNPQCWDSWVYVHTPQSRGAPPLAMPKNQLKMSSDGSRSPV